MKILVTGATGFVGKELICKLVLENHDVVVVTRNVESAKQKIAIPVTYVGWDLDSKILNDIEVVIHLAGEPIAASRWTKEKKSKIYDSRVKVTQNLVDLLMKIKPKRLRTFISASAIGIYGNRDDVQLSEASAFGNDFLATVCRDWESSLAPLEDNDIRVVKVRIGVVLGKQGGALAQMLPIFRAGLGGRLGSGDQWMSWIHIEDLTNVFLTALSSTRIVGAVNAVSPNPVRNKEFVQSLASTLQTRLLLPVPKIALRLVLGEMSDVVLSSQKVTPAVLLQNKFQFKHPELKSALASL